MTHSSKGAAEKWTPGPWTASPTYPSGDYCIHAKGVPQQLAYLAASTQVDWPLEANARLIAAAPDLCFALRQAVIIIKNCAAGECEEDQAYLDVQVSRMEDILAKACGSAPPHSARGSLEP